jgi:selenocysteine lyase/cysteine desulfurase
MKTAFFATEQERLEAFPVAKNTVFLAHAGVTALPAVVARAMTKHIEACSMNHQEFGDVLRRVGEVRATCARAIGVTPGEIALLGPTSLGLSLFANGIEWREGDEVLCYADDYPANIYPWMNLQRKGVVLRRFETPVFGRITAEHIEALLTPRTRLVALSSAHFLTGWRIPIDTIGKLLRERGILFSLDAIQTLGAFPTRAENVDFLSADAHKWMLGPLAAGIVFVAKRNFELCRPSLLGAWNVRSPDFLARNVIEFESGGRRYEPGVLNIPGIFGMDAALRMLDEVGPEAIAARILHLRDFLEEALEARGWKFLSPLRDEPLRSGILTARDPSRDSATLFAALENGGVVVSLRKDRSGTAWLRFSPHFYNTEEELEKALDLLK